MSGTTRSLEGGLAAADLRPSSVGTSEVALNSLGAGDLAPSSVGTSEVANGSIGSDDLAPAAFGARAYGHVGSAGSLNLGRSKNASVTHPATGVYCIALAAGIDPASAVLIVEPEFSDDFTNPPTDNVSVVEWDINEASAGCPVSTLAVRSWVYNGDSTDNDDGGGNTTGDDLSEIDQSFAFVVP
jgi:hypothetical protein